MREGLFECVLQACDSSGSGAAHRKHAIIGNAGIGKTAFWRVYLLMCTVRRQGAPWCAQAPPPLHDAFNYYGAVPFFCRCWPATQALRGGALPRG